MADEKTPKDETETAVGEPEAPVTPAAPVTEEPQDEAPDAAAAAEADEKAEQPDAEAKPKAKAAAKPKTEAKPKAAAKPKSAGKPKAKAKPAAKGERKPITRLPKPEHDRGRRQERRGVVVSAAMDKTIVVKVEAVRAHPRYKKVIRRSTKFHAHDERNVAKAGDIVRIVETRPLSKTKRWRLAEVVEAAR
jgi:small subunit ribosomal protein S17